VKEIEPTIEEWEAAIDFLTATGRKCDDVRQEFILLSEVLGVSLLVETINDAETPEATDSTVLGPFHMVASPERELGENVSPESEGAVCVVRGSILSVTGEPVPGARIDVWQADTKGFYDVQQPGIQSVGNGRGLFSADENGRFHFRSVIPSYYPIPTDGPVGDLLHATRRHPNRPAHIHFIVSAPGYEELTTHIFVAGSPYIDSDAVFAVKDSLISAFTENTDPVTARNYGVDSPFMEGTINIVLHPTLHRDLTTTPQQESTR
jgi:protocatechuate 3,4-dioxygenase beta subunit